MDPRLPPNVRRKVLALNAIHGDAFDKLILQRTPPPPYRQSRTWGEKQTPSLLQVREASGKRTTPRSWIKPTLWNPLPRFAYQKPRLKLPLPHSPYRKRKPEPNPVRKPAWSDLYPLARFKSLRSHPVEPPTAKPKHHKPDPPPVKGPKRNKVAATQCCAPCKLKCSKRNLTLPKPANRGPVKHICPPVSFRQPRQVFLNQRPDPNCCYPPPDKRGHKLVLNNEDEVFEMPLEEKRRNGTRNHVFYGVPVLNPAHPDLPRPELDFSVQRATFGASSNVTSISEKYSLLS